MTAILSTVRLKDEMLKELEEKFSDYSFKYVSRKALTDECRCRQYTFEGAQTHTNY